MFSQNADMEYLKENESLEDLQLGGLYVIQKKDGFRFGLDAVLLADFTKGIHSDNLLDMCTGSGVIPIILSHKTNIPKICGIEIQEEVFDAAVRSVKLNRLEDRIQLTLGDIKNAVQIYQKRSFDLITCNPPYMSKSGGVKNELDTRVIARHEVMCNLEDVIKTASELLKQKGHLVLVHKPTRLADIICLMRQYDIEPKRLRLVHKDAASEPSLVLVDGMYKGGRELRIAPPLYLYDKDGLENPELKEIYMR